MSTISYDLCSAPRYDLCCALISNEWGLKPMHFCLLGSCYNHCTTKLSANCSPWFVHYKYVTEEPL